jgi:hypothetical protein
VFEAAMDAETGRCKSFTQVLALKAVLSWMQQNTPGDHVLIEGGIQLLHIVRTAGLEHPADLLQSALPVRDMVQNAEAEQGVKHTRTVGEMEGIGDQESDGFLGSAG